ncbi:GntR family transcriptional regulator [Cohnella xylanilytica]|uniref:GntR family transcriptional regulator n=1 Tax=Cohnella xylanilytica TaxID=557555 RepID=A0A841TZI1_9BACL|nr:GntR family transcriptional regulator [Cohnella xylanilytica]MBB6693686.1 GntR family transcriptional regulator [Cohnella xylanilytica]
MGCLAVKSISKQQLAYDFIYAQIMAGVYLPGQRIVVEQLVQELSLSPSPIREAIRKLEADGLLRNKPYAGVVVTSFKLKEAVERMRVLAALDGYATALSGPRLTSADLNELDELNSELKECANEQMFVRAGAIDRAFHDKLNGRCDNDYLLNSIKDITEKLNTIRDLNVMFYPMRIVESVKEHETLISYIREGRSAMELEAYMRTHRHNAIEAYTQTVDKV